ncbi:S-adenosyl-L-methionine-dependent methyltransferase, partial [Fimicolochytrium jonesii]|uniref:S-adenosyl-L-methionine-dependent methyltransferase n=1 Tax=Fimicolochytrium jonesii TaxID=1396493 RepID=UPI0022FEECBC
MKRELDEDATEVEAEPGAEPTLTEGVLAPDNKKVKIEDVAESAPASVPESTPVEAPAVALTDSNATTRFRLRVDNLPKYADRKAVEKICRANGVEGLDQCKKAPTWNYCFLAFETEEARKDAMEKLQGKPMKDKELEVSFVNLQEREGMRDMKGKSQRDVAAGREDANDTRTPEERIADQVSPLWRQSYTEQVESKRKMMHKALKKFGQDMERYFPRDYFRNRQEPPEDLTIMSDMTSEEKAIRQLAWLKPAQKKNGGVPCELLEPVHSPQLEGYRNKCEFTFGWNSEGKKVAGFLLGLFKDGLVTVIEPTTTKIVSPAAANIAELLSSFVQSSDLDLYDRINKVGFWRLALVRTFRTGENMVVVQYNPTGVDEATVLAAQSALKAHLEPTKDTPTGVTTLLIQEHDGTFNGFIDGAPLKVLYGSGSVHETLLGLRFRVSPTAFFQVNTEGTELLYSKVREWCALQEVEAERVGRGLVTAGEVKAALPPPMETPDSNQSTVTASPPTEATASETNNGAALSAFPPRAKDLSPPGTILLDLCCGTGTIGLTMASHVKKVIGVDIIASAIADAEHNAQLNGVSTTATTTVDEAKVVYFADQVEKVINQVIHEYVGKYDDVVAVLCLRSPGGNVLWLHHVFACFV